MHEFHIVEGIAKQVLEKAKSAGAKKVTRVALVMGASSGLEESSVRLYFQEISRGTLLEGAELVVNTPASKLHCHTCDEVFDYQASGFNCPKCSKLGVRPSTGKEFYIDHIEIDS